MNGGGGGLTNLLTLVEILSRIHGAGLWSTEALYQIEEAIEKRKG